MSDLRPQQIIQKENSVVICTTFLGSVWLISNFFIANNISHKLLTINQLLVFYISYYTLPSVKTSDYGGDPWSTP